MIEDWDLASLSLERIRSNHYEVAVLPMGATEPHNFHLPHGTDFINVTEIARQCCRQAWEKCHSVLCLPTIPYGVDCNLLKYPMALHVSQAHLDAMVRDIIQSLRRHGIRKIVLLNGHGGNEFMPLIRQMQADIDVHIFLCDWLLVIDDIYNELFSVPDDHGGERETSVLMAFHPELVDLKKAKDGQPRPFRFEALEKDWVRTSRNFGILNDHCACGDPRAASAEKGNRCIKVVCDRVSQFLANLANSKIDEIFPY